MSPAFRHVTMVYPLTRGFSIIKVGGEVYDLCSLLRAAPSYRSTDQQELLYTTGAVVSSTSLSRIRGLNPFDNLGKIACSRYIYAESWNFVCLPEGVGLILSEFARSISSRPELARYPLGSTLLLCCKFAKPPLRFTWVVAQTGIEPASYRD